jgi:hypothetical protein
MASESSSAALISTMYMYISSVCHRHIVSVHRSSFLPPSFHLIASLVLQIRPFIQLVFISSDSGSSQIHTCCRLAVTILDSSALIWFSQDYKMSTEMQCLPFIDYIVETFDLIHFYLHDQLTPRTICIGEVQINKCKESPTEASLNTCL